MPLTYAEKTCPCGQTFTPKGPRQIYHAADCPARSKPAKVPVRPKPKVPVNGAATPELLKRLARDCEQELARLDAEIAPLQAERERAQRAYEALARAL